MPVASPVVETASDAFAYIAAAMLGFQPADWAEWEEALNDLIPEYDRADEWRMEAADLCRETLDAFSSWPPPSPADERHFADYARHLQRLDRWHAPLIPATDLDRSADHEASLDQFYLTGRFNADQRAGIVIPRESPDTPFLKASPELNWQLEPSSFAVLNCLLQYCAYLPPLVSGDDPDKEEKRDTRALEIAFQRFPTGSIPPRYFSDDLRVATAPVLERSDEAQLWTDGDRYSIHPSIAEVRVAEVVRAAITNDADLLLMPEMSIDEALLPALKHCIVHEAHEYFHRTNQLSRLSFVICGVLRKRMATDLAHRNYVAVLSSDGELLFEQDKLSHWNLDAATQKRFDLFGGLPVPLFEDTIPGTAIIIAEIPSLGRLLTLICADISAHQPGDWVADNVGLDWVYAPIMDGSTCWTQAKIPWVIKKACRMAEAGTATIVTNSMSLTYWNNAVIKRDSERNPDYPHRVYEKCGVALAALPIGDTFQIQHITEPLAGGSSPVLHVIDWSTGWKDPPET